MYDCFSETSIHVKNYDLERRRLSADVTLHRSMLDLKQREGKQLLVNTRTQNTLAMSSALRRVVDTKNRLETIYAEQRELNQSAAVAEQDRRAAELMAKMAVGFVRPGRGVSIRLSRMWKTGEHT